MTVSLIGNRVAGIVKLRLSGTWSSQVAVLAEELQHAMPLGLEASTPVKSGLRRQESNLVMARLAATGQIELYDDINLAAEHDPVTFGEQYRQLQIGPSRGQVSFGLRQLFPARPPEFMELHPDLTTIEQQDDRSIERFIEGSLHQALNYLSANRPL